MSTVLSAHKVTLRREFEAKRNAVTGDTRQEADRYLFENLFASPVWKNAQAVLSYCSFRGEIDLSPIWEQARVEGKAYALPRTVTGAAEGRMIFQHVKNEGDLVVGRYGLSEPSSACPEVTDFERALCIVPGLAFDKEGYRLGYGGGYYDRFLAGHPTVIPVGLCYGACLCNRLPRDGHDIPVSYIFTERSVMACVP